MSVGVLTRGYGADRDLTSHQGVTSALALGVQTNASAGLLYRHGRSRPPPLSGELARLEHCRGSDPGGHHRLIRRTLNLGGSSPSSRGGAAGGYHRPLEFPAVADLEPDPALGVCSGRSISPHQVNLYLGYLLAAASKERYNSFTGCVPAVSGQHEEDGSWGPEMETAAVFVTAQARE